MENGVPGLVDLGFSKLEAEIYTALCRQSPLTGYGVAHAIGKPVANTYKAIEDLRNKGAVIVEDGPSRLCRAVPPAEFLAGLERSFHEKKESVAKALSEIAPPGNDMRIYQLETTEQVLERCRTMLQSCKEVALVDAFPEPVNALRADLERAAARGILVAAMVYAPVDIAGVEVIVRAQGRATQKRWPGQWINMVIDGAEHALAFLSADGKSILQAVWSGSPYISWVYHCAVSSEFILAAVRPLIESGAPAKDLRKTLQRYKRLAAIEAPGYRALLKQFQGGSR